MTSPVRYYPALVQNPETAFAALLSELDWVHKDAQIPRKEYYVHADGLPYAYGSGRFSREYQSQPDHPVIEEIRAALWRLLCVRFDVVFLNLYEHERHHLGWHADDSPEMSDDHPIVTVSLGAEREIWFRSNDDPQTVHKVMLESGSACVMLPGMQDTHQHRIPKHDRVCGPRISLTFRKYVHTQSDTHCLLGTTS